MMTFPMKFGRAACRSAGYLLLSVVLMASLLACATAEQKRANRLQEEAYAAALTRGVHAYVYEMSCQAVLPVAEEILIKRGYQTGVYDQQGLMLEMQWKDEGAAARSRYIVQGMALGEQRCNMQIMAEKDTGGQRDTRRSQEVEMELLNRIQPEQARHVKSQARAMAEQMYRDGVLDDSLQEVRDEREVQPLENDQL